MSHKAPYNHEEGLHSDEELELVHVDEDDEDYDEEDYEEEDNEDVSIAVPLSKSVTLTRTRDEVNKTEPLRKSVKLTRTRAELDPPTSSSNKQNSIESPKTNPAMSQRQESAPLTVMKGSGSLPTTQEMNHSYEREWISEPEYRYSRKRKQLMLSCLINVFMIIIVIILATVFVSRRGSTAASSSQVSTDNNVPTTPPVPKPTFKPIKERPEDPDGHPVAPPNMIVDRPTNFDPDAEYEDPPPPPPPTNPQPTPKPPTLPPPTLPPPTAPPPTAPPPTAPPPTQPVIVVPETPPTLEPTITVTLPPHVPAPVPLASEGYVLAFEEVHKTSKWVLENGSILATFGPQIKTVGIAQEDKDTYDCESNPTLESCYEFHRGLDLHADSGSTIYSAYEGKVVAILDTPNEEGLVLEHIFPEEVIFHIDKPGTTTWYTLYFHAANWNVQLDDIVAAGTPLAVMDGEHLHYEVRIGTPCDLQDSIENPATSCNTLGFDPHVHPLMSLPDSGVGQHSIALEILQELDTDASGDGIVRVSTPATNPNMNKFTIAIINVQTGATRASFKIDINRRIGFDATSLDALDTIDRSNPFLQPLPFDATQDAAWQIDIIIPGHWICPKSAEEEIVLTAEDVWGRFKFVAFGLGSEYGANNDCPIDPNA